MVETVHEEKPARQIDYLSAAPEAAFVLLEPGI